MKIFNCEELRDQMEERIKAYTDMCETLKVNKPYLTVISVGENGANNSYVKSKENACKRTGIIFYHMELNKETTEEWVIKKIQETNRRSVVNGLIVQFPIDSWRTINESTLLNYIDPKKDVDGLTPYNMGRLASNDPVLIPCTAKGVVDILTKQLKLDLTGKHVVVIGKGKTSGRPLSLLLPKYGATVSTIDSKTTEGIRQCILDTADVIISCTGKPNTLDVKQVGKAKPVTIINVGMDRVEGKLVGDVDLNSFIEYENRFKYDLSIQTNTTTKSTGLMTVTNLLFNTCLTHLMYEVPVEHFDTLHSIIKELY